MRYFKQSSKVLLQIILFSLASLLVLESNIWECDVDQQGESPEFMQQVFYITPCLFL